MTGIWLHIVGLILAVVCEGVAMVNSFDRTRRVYTIRFMHNGDGAGERGHVETLLEFGGFLTSRTAKKHAARLAQEWTGWETTTDKIVKYYQGR